MTSRAFPTLSAFAVALATAIALILAFGLGAALICGPIRGVGLVLILAILIPIWKPIVLLVPLVAALALTPFVPSLLRQFGGRRFAIGVGITALVLALAAWGFSALNYNAEDNCSLRQA